MNNPHIVNEEDVKHLESVTPAPNVPPLSPLDERGGNFSATLAPGFQHDGNFVKTGYPRGAGVPSFPLLPLPAATLAQVQSTSKQIVTEAIAQIPVPTPAPATAVFDSNFGAGVTYIEDFLGTVGGWTIETNGGAGSNGLVRGSMGGFPVSGAFMMANSNTTNGYTVGFLSGVTIAGDDDVWPLFDYSGWKVTFVFGFGTSQINTAPTFTKKSIYVGLASSWNTGNGIGFPVRPTTFMGVRYDTDTTSPSIADTTFHFEVVANVTNQTNVLTRNNTQGTTFDTGVTPTVGTMYRLDIVMTAPGKITMSLNGSAPQTFNVPVVTAGGIGSSTRFAVKSDTAWLELTSTTGQTQATVFGVGSFATVAGMTGGGTPLNGLHQLQQSNSDFGSPLLAYQVVSPDVVFGDGPVDVSVAGFPGVVPIFTFGNDSQATPSTGSTMFLIDFFEFVWNPAIAGATTAPDPTKPRYF